MYRWQELEQYLHHNGITQFTCEDMAYDLGLSNAEASNLIQGHLYAQRQPLSNTRYVLSRRGRTRAAEWHVGHRSQDAREMSRQCVDDIGVKLHDALEPDLHRMEKLNPAVGQLATNIIAALEANLQLMITAIP